MVIRKFVDLFEINNFFLNIFSVSSIFWRKNLILTKTVLVWENQLSARKITPTRLTCGIQRTKNIVRITCAKTYFNARARDTKYTIMDKTKTVVQRWLFKKCILSFWALKKCPKAQSNPIIPSKVIVLTDDDDNDDRQTPS